jgi:hypothetical protein
MNTDEGPGSTADSKGLIGAIYQTIARQNRGSVWITGEGNECDFISYSYFPKAGKVCLFNIDFDAPRRCSVHTVGPPATVDLAPGEFRLMDLART